MSDSYQPGQPPGEGPVLPPLPLSPPPASPVTRAMVPPRFGSMEFGQIFLRSFSLIRENPKPLIVGAVLIPVMVNLLVMVLAVIPQTLGQVLVHSGEPLAAVPILIFGMAASLVQAVVSVALSALVQGYVLTNLRESTLGTRATNQRLIAELRGVAGRLLLYSLLVLGLGLGFGIVLSILLCVLVAVLAIGGVSLESTASMLVVVPVGLITMLIAVVPLVWVVTKLSLTPALIVLQRATVAQALRGSWRLSRGRFWKILGMQLAIGAIAVVGSAIIFFLVLGVILLANAGSTDALAQIAMSTSLVVLLNIPLLLLSGASAVVTANAMGLHTIDARMRTDWLAASLNHYAAARVAGVPATALRDPFLSPPGAFPPPQPER